MDNQNGSRVDDPRFQTLLTQLRLILGSSNVYYQPPSKYKLQHPCILISESTFDIQHADNRPYVVTDRLLLTLITKRPLSSVRKELACLPTCREDRTYISDNLYHYIYTIYL